MWASAVHGMNESLSLVICVLVIDMDECSSHIRENFDLILELLADIADLPQWRTTCVHDNINFYKIILGLWALV